WNGECGDCSQAGVAKSTDGGKTWMLVNEGLTDLCVRTLAIDPSTPATLFAGTSTGVFRSGDGGAHWSPTSGITSPVLKIAVDPGDSSMLYAVVPSEQTLYRSIDG